MSSSIYPAGPDFPLVIFSSHSWAYGHHRRCLHDMLSPDWSKGVEYIDHSVPSAHPLQSFGDNLDLAEQLSDRVSQSDVVLVMAGMYANFSDWMKAEINFAVAHKRPILAIAPNGQERIAGTATRFSRHPVVRWRGDSIRQAILNAIDPSVRANFLAAKQWRQDTLIAAMFPPLPPPRTPSVFDGLSLPRRLGGLYELGALDQTTRPIFSDLLPRRQTAAEEYGALNPLWLTRR